MQCSDVLEGLTTIAGEKVGFWRPEAGFSAYFYFLAGNYRCGLAGVFAAGGIRRLILRFILSASCVPKGLWLACTDKLGYSLAPRNSAPCHMETRALPVEAGRESSSQVSARLWAHVEITVCTL